MPRKKNPTKTVRAHVQTAKDLEVIAKAFGVSVAAYLDHLCLDGIKRDLPIARKFEASRRPQVKKILPVEEESE